MGKFCAKCGAELQEGIKFCAKCGTPVETVPVEEVKPATEAPVKEAASSASNQGNDLKNQATQVADDLLKKGNELAGNLTDQAKKDPKKFGIVCGAVVLALIVIICIAASGGKKKPVKTFMKGIEKQDAEKVAYSMFPKKFYKSMADETDQDLEDLMDDLEDNLEDSDVKIKSYKFRKMEKMDEDDADDFEDLIELYEDRADYDLDINYKKVYTCKIRVKAREDGETNNETLEFYVYKSHGKWYAINTVMLLF